MVQNSQQSIRNIAILAHVDAGKTTLSERILFASGEVRRPGKVEDGLATMDYMPEEKERGITIESGVAHFEWKNTWFNFIDTPGHVDFGAEVDMALTAVEGAVLVVSAASGVETQTVAAFKKLREAGVRTILFINKLDNPDYSLDDTLINIEEVLGVRPVLMTVPEYKDGKMEGVLDVLSKSRLVHSENGQEVVDPQEHSDNTHRHSERSGESSDDLLVKHYSEAVECASNFDDEILELAMDGKPVAPKILLRGLKELAKSSDYALCYAGSAMAGFGVRSLLTALSFFLPEVPLFNENELGQVIRLRHFKGVGEISLFRSHVNLERKAWPAGYEFSRLKANLLLPVEEIRVGDIYAVRAPMETELGQVILLDGSPTCHLGDSPRHPERSEGSSIRDRYQPLLQTRVECLSMDDYHHVEKSLATLSRMDPSFRVQHDEDGGFWYLHTVGEVQLDVLLARLKREFGCEVQAGNPEVRWQERLNTAVGPVENSFQLGPHKISIKLAASPIENDVVENASELLQNHDIRLSAEFLEKAPREILAGVRSALLESAEMGVLGKGPLVGIRFEVLDFSWTEDALPPMIKKACADAVTKLIKPAHVTVFEPVMELSLECPVNFAGNITSDIQSRNGKVKEIGGDGRTHFLKADIPLKEIFGYATNVRSISKGTALYSLKLLGYRPFAG
ncbi:MULTISPECIES: translation factor GTPase family protein [unclassified Fibrobacter]|uniref:GTP-binding protein n=1 Tax=unclassified Fibrobacter TaxID=2634177 RepID=UPI000D6C6876|nr:MULTISPECIES: TetM/TetW/TetO/TetS family tetracycline resistance ribosomal protection protein [unclassified Fibrobacter]PWJ68952.1 elongation factor G [Fibrobacter sp. UWR4]PZW63555.1 elongation factor G [Fibrobacter sp. UWR1]